MVIWMRISSSKASDRIRYMGCVALPDKQAGRQAGWLAGWQVDRQICRQTGGRTDRQTTEATASNKQMPLRMSIDLNFAAVSPLSLALIRSPYLNLDFRKTLR